MLRVLAKALLAYLVVIVVAFGFSLTAVFFEPLGALRNKVIKPKLGFHQGEWVYFESISVNDTILTFDGFFASPPARELSEVTWWLIPFEGYDTAEETEVTKALGLNIEDIRAMTPSAHQSSQRVGLNIRLHVLPILVEIRTVVIFDLNYLSETYSPDCHARIFEIWATDQTDTAFLKSCEFEGPKDGPVQKV
ncbi:hypothetical protein [uncultured Pelagimonas sp.]|uniref:hypothetical protein n=1 Tax=uncultured Pelagimonas sp. TaxID=1618102 RepID=UPI0026087060|nr:hypothetical protein [uncultured Pelagimonas sp.]